MRDRCRELAHHGQSRGTRQCLPGIVPGHFRTFALRDVLDEGGYARERTVRIEGPRGADADPDHLTVLTAIPFLSLIVLALAALDVLDHLSRSLAIIFMRDINRAERLQFLFGVANHLLKCLISGGEVVLLIHEVYAVRRCLEHAAPALLARTQRCFGIPAPDDFLLEVCGAGGDAPLELRIHLAQRCFGTLPLSDLLT